MTKADFADLSKKSIEAVEELVKKEPLSIIGISEVKGNWEVLVDVLERRAVPDTQDIIGKYKLIFGKDKGLISYKRLETRRRGDVGEEEPIAESTE